MKNVVIVPHLGSATVEVREEMANIVVDNIVALLEGRRPPNIVNPSANADATVVQVPSIHAVRAIVAWAMRAPHPDRHHRQPVSLARSGEGRRWRRSIPNTAWRRSPSADDILAVARDADAVLVTYAKLPGELAAPAQALQGDRPLRARRRQHRPAGGEGARHRGHLRAGLLPARSLRPRHGAAAGAGAQDPALQQAGAVRPLGGAADRAAAAAGRPGARPDRLRQHPARAGAEGQGVRPAR